MTLGDLIKEYREKHNISMDVFSKMCNLSKGYISMLENNTNPRSNKPIAPTLPTIKKIASAINADVDSILRALDSDQEISLDSKSEEPVFYSITNAEIGKRIKYARDLRNATLDDIAKKVGVTKSTIQRYEAGKITTIKLPVVESIAIALNVNPAWVVGKSGEMELPSQKVPKIMQYYEKLNDIGKHEATKRVMELTEVPRYVKEGSTYVNAAHAIEGATEEEIQHDEDIMNDENF